MANFVVSLIMVAVILTVVQAFTRSSLGPQDKLAASAKVMRARTGEIARTELTSKGVTVQDAGTTINFTVANLMPGTALVVATSFICKAP